MLMLGALLSEDFVVFIECDSSELYLSAGDVLHICVFSVIPFFWGGRSVRFDLLCGKIPPCCVGRGVLRRQNNVSARCLFAVGRSGRYVYACGMPADKVSCVSDLP